MIPWAHPYFENKGKSLYQWHGFSLLKWDRIMSGLLLIVVVRGVYERQKADLSMWIMGNNACREEYLFLAGLQKTNSITLWYCLYPVLSHPVFVVGLLESPSVEIVLHPSNALCSQHFLAFKDSIIDPLKLWLDVSVKAYRLIRRGATYGRWLYFLKNCFFHWNFSSFALLSFHLFFWWENIILCLCYLHPGQGGTFSISWFRLALKVYILLTHLHSRSLTLMERPAWRCGFPPSGCIVLLSNMAQSSRRIKNKPCQFLLLGIRYCARSSRHTRLLSTALRAF